MFICMGHFTLNISRLVENETFAVFVPEFV